MNRSEDQARANARQLRIRELNDRLRKTLIGGRVMITQGAASEGEAFVAEAVRAVRSFDGFDPGNDPHGEHDFGSLDVAGRRLFFKIDYYDTSLAYGSPDPADPAVTERVLTIMLASEY